MRLNDRLDMEAAEWWNDRPKTRDKLICHYLVFAEKLANSASRKNTHLTRDECLSAAHLALVESVDRYRPDGGSAFTTFATWRIRGAITDAARENDWVPHAVRADDNKRETPKLPLMLPLDEMFDSPRIDRERWEADLDAIVEAVEFELHRQMIRDLIQLGKDEAVRLSGCSESQFAAVIKWALRRASKAA